MFPILCTSDNIFFESLSNVLFIADEFVVSLVLAPNFDIGKD